jgi:hypothetical protein
LQRPIKRPVKRNIVVELGIDDQWDVDLMDMTIFQTIIVDVILYWWQSISSPNTHGCEI